MSNMNRLVLALVLAAIACSDDPNAPRREPHDPLSAPRAAVDRFGPEFATLLVRTATSGLPASNAPIDFDRYPFITHGLGPDCQLVSYYNFDVLPDTPARIYVLFREGDDTRVQGQLNVIDALPGEIDYNDFGRVIRVTVPRDCVADTVASLEDVADAGYPMEATDVIVNCPVVPTGSTASRRLNRPAEALETTPQGQVPVSPIFVTFTINPGEPGGGPPSGFLTEVGGEQTHDVVAMLPAGADYSPLWNVVAYDNADFGGVIDLSSARAATVLVSSPGLVNCPIVRIQ
jgi:hypothetical protein